jgi:sec-independent protein translocase protein TatB
MFDVGFSELLVIALVALIVIGPERLPKVARTVGHLFGRLQRYVNDVKADIAQEMELDELRKLKSEFESAAQAVESGVREEMQRSEASLSSIAATATASIAATESSSSDAPGVEAGAEIGFEPTQAKTSEPVSTPVEHKGA